MAPLKMAFLCVSLVVLGTLSLYFSMESPNTFKVSLFTYQREIRGFLQLPDVYCKQDPPFLVLLVISSHQQSAARSAIRNTWGRERRVGGKRIKTLFLLGTTPNKDLTQAVAWESQRHRDIIQKDFVDVYYNLTLKTMMGMEWVHRYCPQAAFVMKTDSDMFVNIHYLTELLLRKNRTSDFFTGFLKMNEYPIRNWFSKWYVSKYDYPGNKYPPFCSGTGYVFSGDVASRVYNVSESVPFLKLEDVFVGLCLAKLKIRPEPLHSEQTFFPEGLSFSTCRFRKIVSSHYTSPQNIRLYWRALENSQEVECPGD